MLTLISNGHPLGEIGLKTLVGYMEHHQIPVRAIYLNNCPHISEQLMEQLLDLTKGSHLVGFSMMSKDLKVFLPLVARIRQEQQIPVLWGGIHPTALPKESLEHCDFVCAGEGEEPLRQLYQALANKTQDFSRIPNIGFHDKGHILLNPVTYSACSLDDLPFPDYKFRNSYYLQGFSEGRQFLRIPSDPVEKGRFFQDKTFLFYSQRGCKLACAYCSNSLYHRLAKTTQVKWYRYASVARIKAELRSHLEQMPFIQRIGLNDDDLLERDIEQLEEIGAFLRNDLHLQFSINATPTHVTREKIGILARHGLTNVAMGVQSGSARVLRDVYKRPVTGDKVLAAARAISEFYSQGVTADYGFILDNPYETPDDWRDSLRVLMGLPKPRTITLYSLAFFPGTALSERATQDGFIASAGLHFDKKYHEDIKPTYAYFVFLMNARYDVSDKINHVLLSDFMVKSKAAFLIRFVLGQTTRIYKIKTRLSSWLKSAVPEAAQSFLIKGFNWLKHRRGPRDAASGDR